MFEALHPTHSHPSSRRGCTRCWPAVGAFVQTADQQFTGHQQPHRNIKWAGCYFSSGTNFTCIKDSAKSNWGPAGLFTLPVTVISFQRLPGVMHSYVLPKSTWEAPDHRGVVMDSVPFSHPAQVPPILEILRQQCVFNTLLSSCITSQHVSSGWTNHSVKMRSPVTCYGNSVF